jgi:hypothetical protein
MEHRAEALTQPPDSLDRRAGRRRRLLRCLFKQLVHLFVQSAASAHQPVVQLALPPRLAKGSQGRVHTTCLLRIQAEHDLEHGAELDGHLMRDAIRRNQTQSRIMSTEPSSVATFSSLAFRLHALTMNVTISDRK